MAPGDNTTHGRKVSNPAFGHFPAPQEARDRARANRLDLANWLWRRNTRHGRVPVNRFCSSLRLRPCEDEQTNSDRRESPAGIPRCSTGCRLDRDSGWTPRPCAAVAHVGERSGRQRVHRSAENSTENRLSCRGPRFRIDAEQGPRQCAHVSGDRPPQGRPGVNSYRPPKHLGGGRLVPTVSFFFLFFSFLTLSFPAKHPLSQRITGTPCIAEHLHVH